MTKEEALAGIGPILGKIYLRVLSSDPHEAALAAVKPGGPTVEELEARIRRMQQDKLDALGKAA